MKGNPLFLFLLILTLRSVPVCSAQDQTELFKEFFNKTKLKAEKGDVEAQRWLGGLYLNGQGVNTNYSEAIGWLRKAAEQGHAPAQVDLGCVYHHGRGVATNFMEAMKWYRKAADRGDASGQMSVGLMYSHGWGIEKNKGEAINWLRKAADQGHVIAMYNLGWAYSHGDETDFTEAMKWYRKAVDRGETVSQHCIGAMYYEGQGVHKDPVEAFAWLGLIDAGKYPPTDTLRSRLEKEMSPQQIAQAQKRTKELKRLIAEKTKTAGSSKVETK